MPRQESKPYRALTRALRLLALAFFRRIEVVGLDNLPHDRGGLLVAWHPNGLIDPCLVLTQFPGHVVFGARHGLFSWPVIGSIMRALGTVPIYRAGDLPGDQDRARLEGNRKSLAAMARAVAGGSFAALFPEGKSHDDPHLAPIKTGAARLYYEARAETEPGRPLPAIVPVGIYYDEKRLFRSRALVWFYPPLALPPALDVTPAPDEPADIHKPRVRALTERIAESLEAIVHPADDWTTHHTLHRVRKLIHAERARRAGAESARPSLEEKTLGFGRVRDAYYRCRESDPALAAAMRRRVEAYDARLTALRLDDHALDSAPRLFNPALIGLSLLQLVLIFVLLPPIIVGYIVNWPVVLAIRGAAGKLARQAKDVATVKILIGFVAFPLVWIAVGFAGAAAHAPLDRIFPRLPDTPVLAGVLLALFAAFGGAQALTYQQLAGEAIRNLRVRITASRKADVIAEVLHERAGIFAAVMQLAAALEGGDLGGAVGDIGGDPAHGSTRRQAATTRVPN